MSHALSAHPYAESDREAVRYISVSLVWFLLLLFTGLVLSFQFFWPQLFRGIPFLSFGRFRPVHSQGILYGWLSLAMMGGWLYILPRLTRSPLHSPGLARLSLLFWNLGLVVGMVGVMSGFTQGYEYADWVWPADLLFVFSLFFTSYNTFQTVRKRREKTVYVSLWYMLGTLVYFSGIYLIGNTPLFSGMNQMNINWFLGHSIVGLWFTTGLLAIAYYLFPKVFGNPIYSHRLSLIGFWTIGAFYIQNGPHHLLFSPMLYWLQSYSVIMSIFLLIPVWAVLANFWGTIRGKWGVLADSLPAKFLVAGWAFYFMTCLQGPLQAIRTMSAYEHFTHWVVGHAHLALMGFASSMAIAGVYYIVPIVANRPLHSTKLGELHFWTYLIGTLGMFLDLTVAGLIQASIWRQGLPFIASVIELKSYWMVRSFFGALIIFSQCLFAWNIYRTLRPKQTLSRRRPALVHP